LPDFVCAWTAVVLPAIIIGLAKCGWRARLLLFFADRIGPVP
jgi:hypothetical protein